MNRQYLSLQNDSVSVNTLTVHSLSHVNSSNADYEINSLNQHLIASKSDDNLSYTCTYS